MSLCRPSAEIKLTLRHFILLSYTYALPFPLDFAIIKAYLNKSLLYCDLKCELKPINEFVELRNLWFPGGTDRQTPN